MTRDTNVLMCLKIEEANPIFVITMILWVNNIIKNVNNFMLYVTRGVVHSFPSWSANSIIIINWWFLDRRDKYFSECPTLLFKISNCYSSIMHQISSKTLISG